MTSEMKKPLILICSDQEGDLQLSRTALTSVLKALGYPPGILDEYTVFVKRLSEAEAACKAADRAPIMIVMAPARMAEPVDMRSYGNDLKAFLNLVSDTKIMKCVISDIGGSIMPHGDKFDGSFVSRKALQQLHAKVQPALVITSCEKSMADVPKSGGLAAMITATKLACEQVKEYEKNLVGLSEASPERKIAHGR